MTVITTIPTGSIITVLGFFLVFVSFIGYMIWKKTEDSPNAILWRLFASEFWATGGFFLWGMSFFIMKWSEGFDFYSVSKAIFLISTIIFGVVGIFGIIALVVSTIVIGFILIFRGNNGKKK